MKFLLLILASMLLAIDIGNTNTVFGFYNADKLIFSFRIVTDQKRTSMYIPEARYLLKEYTSRERISEIKRVVIASVVPRLDMSYQQMLKDYYNLEALFVKTNLKLNITIDYPKPSEIGADRICNSVAVYDKFGGPTVVVDFGTATTYDVISAEGAYLGGLIAAGMESAQAVLAQRAAQLFKVSIKPPKSAIGKSTADAMRAGSFLGEVGQIDYIVECISKELGKKPKVVATGGLARVIAPSSKYISEVLPDITLDGLCLIAELNG